MADVVTVDGPDAATYLQGFKLKKAATDESACCVK